MNTQPKNERGVVGIYCRKCESWSRVGSEHTKDKHGSHVDECGGCKNKRRSAAVKAGIKKRRESGLTFGGRGGKFIQPGEVDAQEIAHGSVARAVHYGLLPRPETMRCTDCEKQANVYDHRDYNRILDVEPVCYGCNVRRGPGVPMKLPSFVIEDRTA